MNRRITRRQGLTSLLAMLYLVLFAALAIGFYTTTTTAVTVVDNERRISQAHVAAEGGMEFLRYQLSNVEIPPQPSPSQAWNELTTQVRDALVGTGNLGTKTVYIDNETMRIPSNPDDYIALDATGGLFRADMENMGIKCRVKITGKFGTLTVRRAIQLDYDLAQRMSQIFDYGVASKGKIYTGGSSRIRGATDPKKGSILSANMTDPLPVEVNGKEVSGDVSIVNESANVAFASGTSIGGTTNTADIWANHIHKGVEMPDFPMVNSDIFKPYAMKADGTPNYYTTGTTLTNMVIKAGTNPKFTGGATINGVLYVETPNRIEFSGNTVINGVIVVQNNPTGNPMMNVLDFRGSVTAKGVETLPESYGDLRKLTGSFVLAPSFHVAMSGNFGTINGSIIASKVSMTGNAGGTVMGSVIGLDDTQMSVNGSAEITIASTGTTNYPAGVYFKLKYVPLMDTYEEVLP